MAGLGRVPVPVTKRQFVTPGRIVGGELEIMEAIGLLRPHLKPNLTTAEEAKLRRVVTTLRSDIRAKWYKTSRNVPAFERSYGTFLDSLVLVPASLVIQIDSEGKCANCLVPLHGEDNDGKRKVGNSKRELQVSEAFQIVFEGFLKRIAQVVCNYQFYDMNSK
jgi:hypothetical protein